MGQRIGNVGLLNLLNATPESVQAYEEIGNVGAVLYRTGQAHLLSLLNIGNLGRAIEVPEGYGYYNGDLTIDAAYLDAIDQEVRMVINGLVILAPDVDSEKLANGRLQLNINGDVYAPPGLAGTASRVFTEGSFSVKSYTGALPRFENGHLVLSDAYLQAADAPLNLIVNGLLTLPKELDMELFSRNIQNIDINGMAVVHEEQAVTLYQKMNAGPNGAIDIIPAGYENARKMLRLNSRSIRSFKSRKLKTKKPLILEDGISREMFESAFEKIDSKSFIVCSEEIEDLVYERLDRMETEVLSYADRFVYIEGEEEWSESELLESDGTLNFIVEGQLILNDDVTAETLKEKVAAIDLFGSIRAANPELKGVLRSKLRVSEGEFAGKGGDAASKQTQLQNIGELAL